MCLKTSAQQALTGTINSSMQAVQAAQASLDDLDVLPPLGTDAVSLMTPMILDSRHQNITLCKRIVNLGSSSFFPLGSRHPRLGVRTKWMNPNTKSTPRWTPSRQAQHPWSTWPQVKTLHPQWLSFSHCTWLQNSYSSSSTHTCREETFAIQKGTVLLHKSHLGTRCLFKCVSSCVSVTPRIAQNLNLNAVIKNWWWNS